MAESTEETGRESRTGAQWRADIVGLIANLVRWAGLLIALVLVVHVILVMGNANTANGITTFVRETADVFVLAFKNLFAPEDAKLGVLINYGLAAIFWLVVTTIVARLIRRLG